MIIGKKKKSNQMSVGKLIVVIKLLPLINANRSEYKYEMIRC